jgi:membrane dipeptidase
MIVDAHLDLAYNALRGCEVLKAAAQRPADEEGLIPSVGLPDLHRGNIGLICATIFCEPDVKNDGKGYRTADEAHDVATRQLRWYQQRAEEGVLRFVTSASHLPVVAEPTGPLPMILLMEGADAIRTADDVPAWFEQGLRIVGLAWKRTRLAGGTGAPGPLTSEGIKLVRALDAAGIIHDTSHLAEESFWQLLELSNGLVMASHSNCRSIVDTDRQLSDEMIRALTKRGGVIGINFFDKFLIPAEQYGKRRATLDDLIQHIKHICDLTGSAAHVAIGTDLDGGFGRDQLPVEIQTAGDMPRLAEHLARADFGDGDTLGIMGQNWLRFFKKHLS